MSFIYKSSFKKCFIGVQLICNAVLFSAIQQSESVMYIHIFTLQIFFLYRSLQSIQLSSLCYTGDPYQLIYFIYSSSFKFSITLFCFMDAISHLSEDINYIYTHTHTHTHIYIYIFFFPSFSMNYLSFFSEFLLFFFLLLLYVQSLPNWKISQILGDLWLSFVM